MRRGTTHPGLNDPKVLLRDYQFLHEITKEEGRDLSKAVPDKVTRRKILLAVERHKKREAAAWEDTLPNGISWVSPAVNHCFALGTWNHANDRCCKAHHCPDGLLPSRVARAKNAPIAPLSQVRFCFARANGRVSPNETLEQSVEPPLSFGPTGSTKRSGWDSNTRDPARAVLCLF